MLRITSDREIAKFEAKLKVAKDEAQMWEHIAWQRNATLRGIYTQIINFEQHNTYGESGYRDLYRQIKDKIIEETELSFGDKILRR